MTSFLGISKPLWKNKRTNGKKQSYDTFLAGLQVWQIYPVVHQEVLHFVVENNFLICQTGQHPHFVIGMVARVRKKPAVKLTKKPATLSGEQSERLQTLHASFTGPISREKFKQAWCKIRVYHPDRFTMSPVQRTRTKILRLSPVLQELRQVSAGALAPAPGCENHSKQWDKKESPTQWPWLMKPPRHNVPIFWFFT